MLRSRTLKEKEAGGDGRDEEARSVKRDELQCFDLVAVVPILEEGVFRNIVGFLWLDVFVVFCLVAGRWSVT